MLHYHFLARHFVSSLATYVAHPMSWAVVYHTRSKLSLTVIEDMHQILVHMVGAWCEERGVVFKRDDRGLCFIPSKHRLADAVGEIRGLVREQLPLLGAQPGVHKAGTFACVADQQAAKAARSAEGTRVMPATQPQRHTY